MAGSLIALLRAARGGDDAALEELLALLHHAITKHLHRSLGRGPVTTELIPDAAQEAMVKILKALNQCRAKTDAQLIAWAQRIGRNCAIDELRVDLPKYGGLLLAADFLMCSEKAEGDEPTATPELTHVRRMLEEELSDLSASAHQVIWFRFGEGLTWLEVGCELGIQGTAAKRRWQRISARLERRIRNRASELPPEIRDSVLCWLNGSN